MNIIYNTFAALIVLSTATVSQWSPDPFCPYPSEHVTKYPYYGNCSVYWACYEGTKFLVQCPHGQEFDVKAEECDAPEIANCDPYVSTTLHPTGPTSVSTSIITTKSTVPTTTETSSTTSSSGPDPQCPYPSEEIIYFPYPGDCNKYYECFEGNKYLNSCPEDLWWHQEVTQCDYPGDYCDNSKTSSSVTVTTITTISTTTSIVTTPTPDFKCPYPSEQIMYFPYSGDCNKYWECFEGEAYLYQCPPGLWWHGEVTECDYPGDYCDNSTTTFYR